MKKLQILFQDNHLIAIHKPAGILVHRTRISQDRQFVLQMLRDQIGQWVYPVHRLDRPTSGVLVFGLSPESAHLLVQQFEQRQVVKKYLAVVRGYTEESGRIDYALREEQGKELQQAITDYRRLATVELPYPVGRYQSARFSLLEITPKTGRMHQIRKHMKHIFHPIAGDTTHGDGKQNQLLRERFGINRLLLTATSLRFNHPHSGTKTGINTEPESELIALFPTLPQHDS
jgi:tRNA pseudouridine65 synthase